LWSILALGFLLTFSALIVTPRVDAFCPTNGIKCAFGGVGQTHKDITVGSIKELDQEFFSTSMLTKGMKKAIEEMANANGLVDKDQHTAAKHFDGETFAAGHDRLVSLLNGTISALQSENVGDARSQLGQALHTVQDFYSHSNWVELGGGANPSTWREGDAVSPVSPPFEGTCLFCFDPCRDCGSNLTTSNITSGYYGGEDTPLANPQKCRHGGPFDSLSAGGGGINKDTTFCTFSPHSSLHASAAAAAKEATKLFIRDLKDKITQRQLKLLLGVGPTLAMSIDTTGSMGSVISGVQAQAIQIVDSRVGTDEEPLQYVLSPFNDPFTGPLTVTDDPAVFKSAISALFASGGGDCPELSMQGALDGISAADEGIDLFTFTDASAKDAPLAGAVSALAKQKDAKIYPLLFGTCSPIDPAYIKIAADSGGQLFFLQRSEAGSIARLADFVVRSNAVDVLSINDTLSGVPKTFTVPVDSTMRRVTFSASGTTSAVLTRPDGTTVQATDPGVNLLALSSGTVFSITTPATGAWSVTLNGSGPLSLAVTGDSDLALDAFQFVEQAGRPGHQGLFAIQGFPVAGEAAKAHAEMSGPFATEAFDLRAPDGTVLQSLSLGPDADASPGEFFGDVSLPAVQFLPYVTGLDSEGVAYQRVIPGGRRAQTLKLTSPEAQDLAAGRSTTYVFQVQNLGAPGSFQVVATDDKHFLNSVSPSFLTLGTNQTAAVNVVLQVPATTPVATPDTLTFNVQSTSDSTIQNFAVLTSFVGTPNRPPDCSSAAPSPASLWPPNHELVDVSIGGVTDPDGDPVSIQITSIMQDEATNASGSGDTCPDAQGLGTATAQLRSERSGRGNGRVYTVFFTASDGRGGNSQCSVQVAVPHNQGSTAVDDGPTFDSTACP
jgi:hypothetical protein